MKKSNLKRLAVSLAVLQLLAPLHSLAATYELRSPVPTLTVVPPSGSGSGSGSGGSTGSGSGTVTEPPVLQVTTARWGQTLLDFSGIAVGTTDSKTVKLHNDGNLVANYSTLSSISAPFAVDSSDCAAVQPGASCDVVVSFHPETMGTSTAAGLAPVNGAHLNTLSVTGKGLLTSLELSDSSITSFANTYVGQSSAAKTVLLRNTGNAPVVINPIPTVTGPFTGETTCATELGEAQTCFVNVQFAPLTAGEASGSITVSTGAGEQAVSLSGWGLVPLTAVLSSDWQMPVAVSGDTGPSTVGGANSMYRVYALPSGNDSPLAANFALSDTSVFTFAYVKKARVVTAVNGTTTRQEADCGAVLNANTANNCVADEAYPFIVAAFNRAPVSEGQKTTTLSSAYQGGALPNVVLTTAASGTPSLDVIGSGAFGDVDKNVSSIRTFVLNNSGNGTLALTGAPTVSGVDSALFTMTGTTCAESLAPSAQCIVNVTFSPVANASASATLNISSSAVTSPHSIDLTGTGVSTILGLAVKAGSNSNFGDVSISSSAVQTLVLTNSGNKTATAIQIGTLAQGTGFSIVSDASNTCGPSLAQSTSCEFKVLFAPTITGPASTDITVTHSKGTIAQSVTATGTPPSDPNFGNVVGLFHGEGTVANTKSYPFTSFGNVSTTSASRFGTGALAFDGNGDYLKSNFNAAFTLAENYTLEAWVKPTAVNSYRPIFTQHVSGTPSNFGGVFFGVLDGSLRFAVRPSTGAAETGGNYGSVPTGTWSHVAVSVQGRIARYFVNGQLTGTVEMMPNMSATLATMAIGANSNGYLVGSHAFNGSIDELRITPGVARYTGTFAPYNDAFPNQ